MLDLSSYLSVIIVRCRITGIPGVNKQDAARTQELSKDTGATKRHGRVTKTLFADSKRAAELKRIGSSVRNWLRKASLPGEIDGKYLIPASMFSTFTEKLDGWKREYEVLLKDFVANLDQEIADDRAAKKNLFEVSDYPSAYEVLSSAMFDWGFEPLPDSTKFTSIFDSDELARNMAEKHDNHVQTLFERATEVNMERLRDRVNMAIGQLTRYTGEAKQRLHCSGIVEGMTEAARLAQGLNVSNSEDVATLANAMIQWSDSNMPCENLKDAVVRENAIKALRAMLNEDSEDVSDYDPEPTEMVRDEPMVMVSVDDTNGISVDDMEF